MAEILIPIFFLLAVTSLFFLIGEIVRNIRERRREKFYGNIIIKKDEKRWRK